MRIIFLGATKFSEQMLQHLLEGGFEVSAVFMIPQSFDLKKKGESTASSYQNSNYADIESVAAEHDIPCYAVDSRDGRRLDAYRETIRALQADVIMVLGWYYMVPRSIRDLARLGAYGIHASLLPRYAGGSPLVWALINGEQTTGITMFKFEDGVDDGDILAQKEIPIDPDDDIATLYGKVTEASKAMLAEQLVLMAEGRHVLTPQDASKIVPFPIRTPDDGLMDWNKAALELYNFVRAQTKPYPCAFSFLGGTRVKFVSIQRPGELPTSAARTGEVVRLGSRCYVKASDGLVLPLVVEVDGRELSFDEYCSASNACGSIFKNQ
ncbi:methionyl-tRNA formyltransferase [Geomonas azotofigens]|uniref:methionyl-tRNA formyltransferase n=1 Tax=Geomonas azotofigens TaxID=2843196 RepID=UPI001C0FB2D0|nr:formyltransferase family protein [Geomonas azotofigens]MBU5613374.1 hypothetical protein [Geomonas azotofigens]